MKKILLIIGLFLYLSLNFGVALGCDQSKCSIADAPSGAITDYISDLSKVLNNISSELRKNESQVGNYGKIKSQTLRITNATAGFGGYFSSFDYYVAFPITNDIPYQIERDHKLLLNQNKRILDTIKKVIRNGDGETNIPKACDGVRSENCLLNNQSAENILTGLLRNHKNIVYFYQLSVTGKSQNFQGEFILVEDDFERIIAKDYGTENVKSCSSCEDGFEDRINKSIKNIGKLNDDSQGAINKWKYAWAILTGDESSAEVFLTRTGTDSRQDFYTQSVGLGEEDTLRRYLGESGAGPRTSEIAIGNLKRYNENKKINEKILENPDLVKQPQLLSTGNPLENTARNTFSDINIQIDAFEDAILQSYESGRRDDFPTSILKKTQNNIIITQAIKKNITDLYQTESSFNIVKDTSIEKLQSKIIQMHIHLSQAINVLDETREVSEKVCNSQGKGLGKCSYR